MNDMEIFEAVTMIDEDIIIEAEEKNSPAAYQSKFSEESGGTVSGVDVYRKNIRFRIAAIAAAALLTVGLGSGGALLLKEHGSSGNKKINEEPVDPETVTSVQEITETASYQSEKTNMTLTSVSTETADKKDVVITTVKNDIVTTVSSAGANSAPVQETTVTSVAAEDHKITGNGTTEKAAEQTATRPVTGGITNKTSTTEKTSDKRLMTKDDLRELARKGRELKVSDFYGFIGEDIGSGLYCMKYEIKDVPEEYVLVMSDGTFPEPFNALLKREDGTDIDIRSDEFRRSVGVFEEEPGTVVAEPVSKRRITTDDIKRLSAKGMELKVSDFDEFIGEDIGSGLFVMKYEIEDKDTACLIVGFDGMRSEPLYTDLELDLAGESHYMGDIRTEQFRRIFGKTFRYEKGGMGGDCTISFDYDFYFTQGPLSNYACSGIWSISDDILTVTDYYSKFVSRFRITGDDLIYIKDKERSPVLSNMISDGDRFTVVK